MEKEKQLCPECGTQMTASKGNYKYDASGLDGIVLAGITMWRCPECGEVAAEIPRIMALHEAIARHLVTKPARLAPKEIRFLRKHLGWSGADFARHMGVGPEVVSRWENKGGMGGQSDRLLRALVQIVKPSHDYSVETLINISEKTDHLRLRLQPGRKEWEAAAA